MIATRCCVSSIQPLTWTKSNGCIHGLKKHVAYNSKADYLRIFDIIDANVNDPGSVARSRSKRGVTYASDKAMVITAGGARYGSKAHSS